MKFSTLIKHSAELYRIILKSPTPADELASQYLRSKKYIGSSERKVISELVFCTLRINSLAIQAVDDFLFANKIDTLSENADKAAVCASLIIAGLFPNSPLELLQTKLNKFTSTSDDFNESIATAITELEIFGGFEQNFLSFCTKYALDFLVMINSDKLLTAKYLCMQGWIITSLSAIYSAYEINQLAFKLMYSAPVCLRVNTIASNRDSVLQLLADSGIPAMPSELSPDGIILKNRPQLNNLEIYKNGAIEVQDIGSQIISYSMDIELKYNILDACAGAGGKTLHIAALANDDANIIATDIEFKRLKEISIRANKSGISSITVVQQKKMELKSKIKTKFDSILIDAPCSGTGTVRRMPMPKWRLTQKLLAKLNKNQFSILEYYSEMLEIGGTLVYATCSLLPEENEQIIRKFLSEHDNFSPQAIKPALIKAGVNTASIPDDAFFLYLSPLNSETDGFFLSKIIKTQE